MIVTKKASDENDSEDYTNYEELPVNDESQEKTNDFAMRMIKILITNTMTKTINIKILSNWTLSFTFLYLLLPIQYSKPSP